MDKINITSLGLLAQPEYVEIPFENVAVTVCKKLSYEQMLDMLQYCIDFIVGDKPFISEPLKIMVRDFAIIKFYTNIDCDFILEVPMSEVYSNYDFLANNEVLTKVKEVIDEEQLKFFKETLDKTLTSILAYRNSAQGILETLSADAGEQAARMQEAINFVTDPETKSQMEAIIGFAKQIQ